MRRYIQNTLLTLGLLAVPVAAQNFTNLHNLGSPLATPDKYGAFPYGELVLSGNTLYGTASDGGTNNCGTIFAVNTDGSGFAVLHVFSRDIGIAPARGRGTNSDGVSPYGGFVLSGNTLYGTATQGGANGSGTVFAIDTSGTNFTVVHSFSMGISNSTIANFTNSDGAAPSARLLLSGNRLYGTTASGGTNGGGTVFAVNTDGNGFETLHAFAALNSDVFDFGTNSDGAVPLGGLVLSGDMLYGTTFTGSSNANGTVFGVSTTGTGFNVLHTFSLGNYDSSSELTNNDGANPYDGLVLSGNTLYGTTSTGGLNGSGTVFAVNTDGSGFATVFDFDSDENVNSSFYPTNTDGASLSGGLVLSGNTLYGTASYGGTNSYGTVFAVNTDGMGFETLHTFSSGDYIDPTIFNLFTNSDGANPYAGLILENNTLYGTTLYGGTNGEGAVFSISVPPAVDASPFSIIQIATNVILSWPTNTPNLTLQSTTNLFSQASWAAVSSVPIIVNRRYTVTDLISDTQKYYRLRQ